MKRILLWLSVGVIVMIVMGCRTLKTTVIQSVRHDTVYVSRMGYDSIFMTDSNIERYVPSVLHYDTIVQAYLRIDTLYKERLKKEYRYKMLHDTMYVMKIDTIPRIVTTTGDRSETSGSYIPLWCKILAGFGLLTILVTVIVLIIKLSK